ncbi:YciI family protein [Ruania halotolerans]|uniref:YciI family protein n=1 Tax=Ruania halotolerans TaxID=2897773 RepID=UPI001E583839|nr:YciI family protein [Ruania halotolerans]UFU06242.1 YciI family protein [Ruania halotolerans]
MTQYLLSVWHDYDEPHYADEAEMQKAFAQVDAFNKRITEAGQWVFGGGLEAPSAATTVDNSKGKALVTDAPLAETREQIGGFWVIEAPDLDAALAIAQEASAACMGPVEVRPFQSE